MKNGKYFLHVVAPNLYRSGVWDPYSYRDAAQNRTMGNFVDVSKIPVSASLMSSFKFNPIEYRHIHRGTIPTFTVEPSTSALPEKMPTVGEACLLFGTMRAYLGNA